MKTILVLCHGNINRSPFCAEILRKDLSTKIQLEGWKITEAALVSVEKEDWKPQRASKKTREAAKNYNVDLEKHRSVKLTKNLLDEADIVIYMDNGNLKRLLNFNGPAKENQKWFCLGQFSDPVCNRIPDPAFISKDSIEFEKVIQLIHSSSKNLAQKLIAEY